MEKIAEKITGRLIEELSNEKKFYTPQDLLSAGIPYFVVETLRDTVSSTIETGMKLPDSDWIQTDAEEVKEAWEGFVRLTKQHIKIPSSKLPKLLGSAVEQCLKLLVQPCQSVPEFIYKTPTDIDLKTAKKRVSYLEVSQQLGLALVRYMEKKEKEILSFEEARGIIKKIDQKMVENFHPLNWAQALKPVFELAGPEVDSELLRIFFEDKGKRVIARKFELLDKRVNETEFIEILSSVELLDVEGYEDQQQQLFGTYSEVDVPDTKDEQSEPDENQEFYADEEKDTEESGSGIEDEVQGEEESITDTEDSTKEEIKPETDSKTGIVSESEEISESESEVEETQVEAETESKIPIEIDTEGDDEQEHEPEDVQENIATLFSEMREAREQDELLPGENEEKDISLIEKTTDSQVEDEEAPLLNKFMFDEDETEENEVNEESEVDFQAGEEFPEDEPTSIYEEMNLVREDEKRGQVQTEETFKETETEEGDDEESVPEDSSEELSYKIEKEIPELTDEEVELKSESEDESVEKDEDEPPMWRSFLERDDMETESGYEYEEEEPDEDDDSEGVTVDEEGFIEEPIYDLTATEPEPEEKIEEVSKWLDDEKDRFVNEIFGNSEIAYEQALLEIMEFDDWKSASYYLEREVFARNRIEVYDEVAVDFTDRLHSYFMQNKS